MKRTVFAFSICSVLVGSQLLAACDETSTRTTKGEAPVEQTSVALHASPKALAMKAPAVRADNLIPRKSELRLSERGAHFTVASTNPKQKLTAEVRLPGKANGAVRLATQEGQMQIEVTAVGVDAVKARTHEGTLHYAEAYGQGTELVQVPTADGTEDYVHLATPSRSSLDYQVHIGAGVAGLRLVNHSLEFLDKGGVPRLRVAPPYGVDADGKRFDARLAVDGCHVDQNPAGPWGRVVTAPGSDHCTVHVTWNNAGLNFPIAVDPAWTSTASMSAASNTWELPAVLLSSGKVLAVPSSTVAQLFDPVTNTWAATGAPPMGLGHRSRMVATFASRAWATGGLDSNMAKTASYDIEGGTWKATADTPDSSTTSDGKALVHTGNGKVLVFNHTGSVHEYDSATNTYAAKTSAPRSLGYNIGAWQVGSFVWIQGGNYDTAARYDITNDAWKTDYTAPIFASNNNTGQLSLLSDGKFLAWGRGNYARLWDPIADTATNVAFPPGTPDIGHLCFRVPANLSYGGGKKHLIGAGRCTYDEATGTITDNGPSQVDVHGVMIQLQDGRFLGLGQTFVRGGQSETADFFGPASQVECDGDFKAAGKPVYNAGACVACVNDNGGAAPACPTAALGACASVAGLVGQCVECSATKFNACTGTKAACNVASGNCAGANGDFGTMATLPCPTAANPFAKADGSCGLCVNNAECAGPTHAGPICAPTGECGTECDADNDCGAMKFCDTTGTKACVSQKADGASCTRKEECSSDVCTDSKCGMPGMADAGADGSADASSDGGSDATPDSGRDSGAASSSGASGSTSSSGGAQDGGGTSSSGNASGGASSGGASSGNASGGTSSGGASSSGSSSGSGAPAEPANDVSGGGCSCNQAAGQDQGTFATLGLAILGLAVSRRKQRS
jgi:Dickkopf N-terminal cysteine-rich region